MACSRKKNAEQIALPKVRILSGDEYKPMMKLSISLVIYNTKQSIWQKTITRLAESIANITAEYETVLYIIDNSPDSRFVAVMEAALKLYLFNSLIITNPANKGYGYGNNLAIEQIDSDYHLVMNPDIYLAQQTLQQALLFMQQHQDVGLLAAAIQYPDGQWQYSFKSSPTLLDHCLRQLAPGFIQARFTSRMQKFEGKHLALDQVQFDVPSVMGSFMFFRTRILKQVKGFDPGYFLYFEDDDISQRLRKIARTAYVPSVRVIHEHAHQTQHDWRHKMYFVRSLLRYCFRWGGFW